MTRPIPNPSRREALRVGLAAGLGLTFGGRMELFADELARQEQLALFTKVIPGTSERIPVVGLGTNRYSVNDPDQIASLCEVLQTLADRGGRVIDTARGYGRAEEVIGECVQTNGNRGDHFLSTKYSVGDRGGQLEDAFTRLRTDMIDLMYVHNLGGTDTLLPVMREMKQEGRFRYIGISISRENQYAEMVRYMRQGVLDFIQVDYSVGNRNAEELVLPAAIDAGLSVLINLPFDGRGGQALAQMGDRPLPDYASEIDCTSWAQLYLKWIVSHPAVTVAIPGTRTVEHAVDNNGAARGRMPDAALRTRIQTTYDEIVGV